MPFTQEMPSDCTACLGRCKAPDGCAQHGLDLTAKVKKKKPNHQSSQMTLVLIMNDQCKNVLDLSSHMILRAILSLILIDQCSVTQMLYASPSFISGETFIRWFIFLPLVWWKAERTRNRSFLLVLGCRGQGAHKPSGRWDCVPCAWRARVPHQALEVLCAVPACCVPVPAVQDDEHV